jgi:hypothetical protein
MKSVTLGRLLLISGALVLFVASVFGQNAAPPITLPTTAGPAPVKSAEPAPVKTATTVSGAGGAKEVVPQSPPAVTPSTGAPRGYRF